MLVLLIVVVTAVCYPSMPVFVQRKKFAKWLRQNYENASGVPPERTRVRRASNATGKALIGPSSSQNNRRRISRTKTVEMGNQEILNQMSKP